MSDAREMFIQDVGQRLVTMIDKDQLDSVIGAVTMALSNYEITERSTELALLNSTNEKLLKRYCACLMVDGKSEKTIKGYKRSLEKFSEFIQKPFADVGVYDVRYYLACEKQRGLANTSLETTRSYIAAFYHWMAQEEIIPKNFIRWILGKYVSVGRLHPLQRRTLKYLQEA